MVDELDGRSAVLDFYRFMFFGWGLREMDGLGGLQMWFLVPPPLLKEGGVGCNGFGWEGFGS